MGQAFKFTTIALRALKAPTGKQVCYKDTTSSLRIFVSPKGQKTFKARISNNGVNTTVKIGTFPEISLDDARIKAREVEVSEDPALKQKRKKENDLQFCTVMEKVWDLAFTQLRKSTLDGYVSFRRCLDEKYRGMAMDEIKPYELAKLVKEYRTLHGESQGKQFRSFISRFYNVAMDTGLITEKPIAALPKLKDFNTPDKDRVMTLAEENAYLEALAEEPNEMVQAYFRIIFYVGRRKTETRTMRWEHLDLIVGQWLIPRKFNKSKRDQIVMLPDNAIEVLYKLSQKGPWVFHGNDPDKPFNGVNKAFTRWRTRAVKICPTASTVTLHDMRRTVGTRLAEAGVPPHLIMDHLGQTDVKMIAIYQRARAEGRKQTTLALNRMPRGILNT